MAVTLNANSSTGFIATSDTSSILQLQTGGTTAVTVDASQNVGIGTASPSNRLHVVSAAGTVQVKWSDATNGTANLDTASGLSRMWTNVGLAFGTGAETYTERARIDTSGNLLVGTTTTAANPTGFSAVQYSGGTYIRIAHSASAGTSDGYIQFFYNSTQIGSVAQNGTSAVQYLTSSDYRLKENIAPMTGALAVVLQLNPVTYSWKSDGTVSQGFIAHELQTVVPDCVNGEKDAVDAEGNPQYQGIDTSFLVATLTAAIQEQQALIIQLQADVAALKAQP